MISPNAYRNDAITIAAAKGFLFKHSWKSTFGKSQSNNLNPKTSNCMPINPNITAPIAPMKKFSGKVNAASKFMISPN
jgi:hypothetical protein